MTQPLTPQKTALLEIALLDYAIWLEQNYPEKKQPAPKESVPTIRYFEQSEPERSYS